MKKLFFLFVVSTFIKSSFAQNVNIPDANFKAALIANTSINTNADSDIQVTEANVFNGLLDVRSKNITDLTGIEAFTALTTLTCSINNLSSIDITNNTALKALLCDGNQLTTIDVSANTALTLLGCSLNQLTSLDISNNTNLIHLFCDFNQLTSLDVSNNSVLYTLNCGYNQLTNLDLVNNTALVTLDCNANLLTSIDVSVNTILEDLTCGENQLTSIDVTLNTALRQLHCHGNQLTNLNIIVNTALIGLDCSENQLTNLDVTNNTALTALDCGSNPLTSIDVSNNTDLEMLFCNNNQLTNIDVSNNIDLVYLWCSLNQLTNLDVTNNIALMELYCDYNQLTGLNVKNGHNTAITAFDAKHNPNLTCIIVDNVSYSNANWSNKKDITASFNTNLNCLNEDASLLNLTTSIGTLSPSFVSTITNYTVSLPFGTTGVATLTPTLSTTLSTVTSNTIASDVAGTFPANQAFVVITAQSGATITYTVTYSVATGIDDLNDGIDFSFYPNPSNGLISVVSENNHNSKIEITNTLGETVYVDFIVKPIQTINLSDQPKGIYFIRVSSLSKQKKQKIILQ